MIGNFKWKKNFSKFDEKFLKRYDKNSDKVELKLDVEYPKSYTSFTMNYYSY